MSIKPILYDNKTLKLLDQRLLPTEEVWLEYRGYREVAEAIRTMVVRGAPAIARRSGVADAEVGAVLRSLGAEERATMLEMPQFGVSSSAVRERAAAGRPLRYLVPEAGARFIEEEGMYA